MSERCPFGLCDGSGFVVDEEKRVASPCRCRPQRVSRARARALSAVIPPRFRGIGFDRPPVTEMRAATVQAVRRFAETITDRLRAGEGCWLVGDVGTGKTTLAMLISKAALEAGHGVAIYSLPRLLAELRTTYDEHSEHSFLGLMDRLTAVELLHIDDVGAEKTSPWVLEQLYAIVNARYEDNRAIVMTTNLQPEQLREQIGERTVSRLNAICGTPLPLFGPDMRSEQSYERGIREPLGLSLDGEPDSRPEFEPFAADERRTLDLPGYGDAAFRLTPPTERDD